MSNSQHLSSSRKPDLSAQYALLLTLGLLDPVVSPTPSRTACAKCKKQIPPGKAGRLCKQCRTKES